ncbi:flagellar motor switch protein FliM [Roseovarius lutimaris]|uniref:Flagellar motor switch protein FliM n=1 Tax=Roseovarius lutimaris TaxID=1005928 RepID=A0A1I5FEX1_9RHOB|nr:FliM/FliN family flagellar motor switch protein [Roseovarius lutimaris]SFO22287.1 flagellar motor switch protein FliM [Roseovarius lutimaris]
MGSQDRNSVIHRKAQAARGGFDSRLMSPARALRLSLARTADTLLDLALTVVTVEQLRVPLSELAKTLGDEGLLLLLEGENGQRGALSLDPQFLAGLIEVQTTGAVRQGAVEPRPPTRTDAAMVAPLINALLSGYDEQMAGGVEGYQPRTFEFGDMVEDTRALALAMTAPDYDFFRITADLGPGAKTGCLSLLLPVAAPVAARPDGKKAAATGPQRGIRDVAINAPIVLDVALARVSLQLKDVWAFKPGMLVPVSPDCLGSALVLGTTGHLVAEARLGQMNGWRAVRLVSSAAAPLPDLEATDTAAPQEVSPPANPTPPVKVRKVADIPEVVEPPIVDDSDPIAEMAGAGDLIPYE